MWKPAEKRVLVWKRGEILPIAIGRSKRIKISKSLVLSIESPKALKREQSG